MNFFLLLYLRKSYFSFRLSSRQTKSTKAYQVFIQTLLAGAGLARPLQPRIHFRWFPVQADIDPGMEPARSPFRRFFN